MKLLLLLLLPTILFARLELRDGPMNIGDRVKPDASSIFQISSTTKGFLSPKMTTAQRDLIASPAIGLEIFNTDTVQKEIFDGLVWSGVGTSNQFFRVTQAGHGRPIGSSTPIPVYLTGGIWTDARADSEFTLATHVIVQVIDANSFVVASSGRYEMTGHGFTPENHYYVSDSATGVLSLDEATLSNPVIFVEDANIVHVMSLRASTLAATTVGQVDTVFGRVGNVVAQAGDYNATEITSAPYVSVSATNVQDAINELQDEKQPLDTDLTSLSSLTGAGLVTRTGAATYTERSITAGSLAVSVANGDGVLGNPSIDVNLGSIDHDGLLNYDANEHIDWTGATQNFSTTGTATTGDLTVNNNITLTGTVDGRDLSTDGSKLDGIEAGADITDATNVEAAGAIMDGDFTTNGFMVRTGAGTYLDRSLAIGSPKLTLTNADGVAGNPSFDVNEAFIDHDLLLNYNPAEHQDMSTVLLDVTSPNDGLAVTFGTGFLDASFVMEVDIDTLPAESVIADPDLLMMFDDSDNGLKKITLADLIDEVESGINPLTFQGTWDAAANNPALFSGVGAEGDFYVVNVAGPTILDGNGPWNAGDQALFQGGAWNQIPAPAINVNSVFGRIGNVVAQANDYTWAQVDKTTSDLADITTKSHTVLTDIGVNSHAAIDTHIADLTLHRIINDAGTSATELWSANKIDSDLAGKANVVHTHDLTTDVTGILPIANGGTGSATQNFVDLTTAQVIAGAKTFSNDMTVNANISTTGNVDGRDLSVDGTKLDGIEALADVTDATNVAAAGAIMFATDFLDEDNMISDSDTQVASQQSIKAYVDNSIAAIPAPPVTSVHGRTGIVIGVNGDYTASNITNVPSGNLVALEVQGALDELQTDVDGREPTITGAATSITGVDLTADRVLISDGLGKVSASGTAASTLGDLAGLTGPIQTQLDTKIETASNNGGVGSVGIFQQKTLVDLEFKGLNAGSNKVSIIDDVANDEVDIDVVEANIDHDSLNGFVADEHVDHSTVSINTATGLTGGGDITATRTIDYDILALPFLQAEQGDQVILYDTSAAVTRRATVDDLNNNQMLVSSNDITLGYLEDKIVSGNLGITVTTINEGVNEDVQISPVYGTVANSIAEGNHTHTRATLDLNNGIADLWASTPTANNTTGEVIINLDNTETLDATYFSFDAPTDELTALLTGRYRITYATTIDCLTGGGDRVNISKMQRAVGAGAFVDLQRSEVETSCDNNVGTPVDPDRARDHSRSYTLVLAANDRLRIIYEKPTATGDNQAVNTNLLVEYLGP